MTPSQFLLRQSFRTNLASRWLVHIPVNESVRYGLVRTKHSRAVPSLLAEILLLKLQVTVTRDTSHPSLLKGFKIDNLRHQRKYLQLHIGIIWRSFKNTRNSNLIGLIYCLGTRISKILQVFLVYGQDWKPGITKAKLECKFYESRDLVSLVSCYIPSNNKCAWHIGDLAQEAFVDEWMNPLHVSECLLITSSLVPDKVMIEGHWETISASDREGWS